MLKYEKTETRPINGETTEVCIYKNSITGSTMVTYLLYKDEHGNKWWTFEDMYTMPFIRQMTAKRVIDLYGHGLSKDDIKTITESMKVVLKSDSAEKYEQAYAKVLELDNLVETMADPVKQCMGLCTVYILLNDEMPDTWTQHVTSQKMAFMTMNLDLQAFFLNWWTGIMRRSGLALKGLSQIASILTK